MSTVGKFGDESKIANYVRNQGNVKNCAEFCTSSRLKKDMSWID